MTTPDKSYILATQTYTEAVHATRDAEFTLLGVVSAPIDRENIEAILDGIADIADASGAGAEAYPPLLKELTAFERAKYALADKVQEAGATHVFGLYFGRVSVNETSTPYAYGDMYRHNAPEALARPKGAHPEDDLV